MTSPDPLLDLDYRPKLPRGIDRGIGIVGAGGIVQYAHLPAYKQAGFQVVGITDADTIRVQMPDGATERVRLIGVDAP